MAVPAASNEERAESLRAIAEAVAANREMVTVNNEEDSAEVTVKEGKLDRRKSKVLKSESESSTASFRLAFSNVGSQISKLNPINRLTKKTQVESESSDQEDSVSYSKVEEVLTLSDVLSLRSSPLASPKRPPSPSSARRAQDEDMTALLQSTNTKIDIL